MASPALRTRRQQQHEAAAAARADKAAQKQNGGGAAANGALNGALNGPATTFGAGKQQQQQPRRFKRIHRIAAVGSLALAAWLAALSRATPEARPVVAAFPLLAAAAFALLLLWRLVRGVLTFRTCPEAEAELRRDIARARKALAARGFRFEEEEEEEEEAVAASGERRRGGGGGGGGGTGNGHSNRTAAVETAPNPTRSSPARRRRA
jgi:hypothetical protein